MQGCGLQKPLAGKRLSGIVAWVRRRVSSVFSPAGEDIHMPVLMQPAEHESEIVVIVRHHHWFISIPS
jgi:hypothetical protein